LRDRRQQPSVLDISPFRGADCDTDHYLAVAKVRTSLTVSKQIMHRFHTGRFNLKKLNEVDGKEQYWVETNIGSQLWKT
jgi:hypothetical protein